MKNQVIFNKKKCDISHIASKQTKNENSAKKWSVSTNTGCSIFPSTNDVYPTVLFTNKKTECVFKQSNIPIKGIVVRIGDFLNSDGTATNPQYAKIVADGGLSVSLNYFDEPIILSSIMEDRKCYGLTRELFSEMILNLKPSAYMTPDLPTYLDKTSKSMKNILKLVEMSTYLQDMIPEIPQIGLVKGCNIEQTKFHTKKYLELGINEYVFHLSGYTKCNQKPIITKAYAFAYAIREMVPHMIIYGVGSSEIINQFHFCDGIITQSHYVEPRYGVHTDLNGQLYSIPNKKQNIDEEKKFKQSELFSFPLDENTKFISYINDPIVKDITEIDILNPLRRIYFAFSSRHSKAIFQTDLGKFADNSDFIREKIVENNCIHCNYVGCV